MKMLNENEAKENCVLCGEIFSIMAEQNLNRGRQLQVTCILNQILNVNVYHYE